MTAIPNGLSNHFAAWSSSIQPIPCHRPCWESPKASRSRLLADDAQVSMNNGLNLPSAESKLLEWARENPSLARQLQDFVTSRIELLREYKSHPARRESSDEKADELTDDLAVEREYYQTMLKVLALALKIDPESNTLRTQVAMVEEFYGNYESAHVRLTELIDATRARGDRKDRDELIDWIVQQKPGRDSMGRPASPRRRCRQLQASPGADRAGRQGHGRLRKGCRRSRGPTRQA